MPVCVALFDSMSFYRVAFLSVCRLTLRHFDVWPYVGESFCPKGWKGFIVFRTWHSIHDGSLKISFIVPLIIKKITCYHCFSEFNKNTWSCRSRRFNKISCSWSCYTIHPGAEPVPLVRTIHSCSHLSYL